MKHPVRSWSTGEVLKWGDHCFPNCVPDFTMSPQIKSTSLNSTSNQLTSQTLHPFRDLFGPKRAFLLLPHRPWQDLSIYPWRSTSRRPLIKDTSVPRGLRHPWLAHTHLHKRTPTLPWLRKLLPSIYPELLLHNPTMLRSSERQAQVSVSHRIHAISRMLLPEHRSSSIQTYVSH